MVQGVDSKSCRFARPLCAESSLKLLIHSPCSFFPLLRFCSLARLTQVDANKLETFQFTQGCPGLVRLSAQCNRLSSLAALARLPHLEALDLAWNTLPSLIELEDLAKLAPTLQTLDISYNPFLERVVDRDVFTAELAATLTPGVNVSAQDLADATERRRSLAPTTMDELVASPSSFVGRAFGASVHEPFTQPWLRATLGHQALLPPDALASSLGNVPKPHGLVLFGEGAAAVLSNISATAEIANSSESHTGQSGTDKSHTAPGSGLPCSLSELRWLWLARTRFAAGPAAPVSPLWQAAAHLVELTLSGCLLTTLEPLAVLKHTLRLDVSRNRLDNLRGLERLTMLQDLCASCNQIRHLQPLAKLPALEHLYLAQNAVSRPRAVFALRGLQTLRVLDVSNNPLCRRPHVRSFVLFYLSHQLAVLNREAVSQSELDRAHRRFANVLTEDVLADMLGEERYRDVRALDMPRLDFRDVRLSERSAFRELYSLNLEENNLMTLEPLAGLPCLRVLCLTGNRIRRYSNARPSSSSAHGGSSSSSGARLTSGRRTATASAARALRRPVSPNPRAGSATSARGIRPGSSSPRPPQRGGGGGGGSGVAGGDDAAQRSLAAARAERQAQVLASLARGKGGAGSSGQDAPLPQLGERGDGRFPCLEVLMLSDNGLTHLQPLELERLPRLRALFLDDNDIGSTAGLGGLTALEVLVLDRNRVKVVEPGSLALCPRLTELHLGFNRLADTAPLQGCTSLRRLVLESNRLAEFTAIEPLVQLPRLQELVLTGNAMMRRPDSRLRVVYHLPRLLSLNLTTVGEEERTQAAFYFGPSPEEAAAQHLGQLSLAHGVVSVGHAVGERESAAAARREVTGPTTVAVGSDWLKRAGPSSRTTHAAAAPSPPIHGSPMLPNKLMVRRRVWGVRLGEGKRVGFGGGRKRRRGRVVGGVRRAREEEGRVILGGLREEWEKTKARQTVSALQSGSSRVEECS